MDALIFDTLAEAEARNQQAFEAGQELHLFPEGTVCFAPIMADQYGDAFAIPWPEEYRMLLLPEEINALEPLGGEWYPVDLET